MPFLRSANHFHDPLTETGFRGYVNGVFLAGQSSVLWAQSPVGTQTPGGCYSWADAREYYHKALTLADPAEREHFFAETFRGLGQVMHLLQDLSVPEHARGDDHYWPAYESWIKDDENVNVKIVAETGEFKIKNIFNPFTAGIDPEYKPISITPNDFPHLAPMAKSSFPIEAPVPIARLFDSNTYDGTNPEATLAPGIGLSEYTNANFVSGDTLFPEEFPYPSPESGVSTLDVDIPHPELPGHTLKRPYYLKTGKGDRGYLLAGVNYFHYYITEQVGINDPTLVRKSIPPMDGYVFAGYAEKLLPKAIGYSAALLDYFFRGEIDIIPNPYGAGQVVINSSSEPLAGEFYLYVDDADGQRQPVTGNPVLVVEPDHPLLPGATSAPIAALPSDIRDSGEYFLVFRGRLGNEEGAVIGRQIRHWEPWGTELCENHTWEVGQLGVTIFDWQTCNPFTWVTLHDGVLSLDMPGEGANGSSHYLGWYADDGPQDANALTIKIDAELLGGVDFFINWLELFIRDEHGNRVSLVLAWNPDDPYAVKPYPGFYFIGDNNGEPQTITLFDKGITGRITVLEFFGYAGARGGQKTLRYDLDYIDLHKWPLDAPHL